MTPRKHYFRCADSILREPWSRDEKLTLVLLMAHLNSRWRRDGIPHSEAGNCSLGRGEMAMITGRSRLDKARIALSSLSDKVSLSIVIDGEWTLIKWPKYAEFQEFDSRNKGQSKADQKPLLQPPPSPSPTPYTKSSIDDLDMPRDRGKGRAARSTASRPAEIPEPLWLDYLAVRADKRAKTFTATALAGIQREAALAGISLEAAMTECVERGWIGFKAAWHNRDTQTSKPNLADNLRASMQAAARNMYASASPADREEFEREVQQRNGGNLVCLPSAKG